MDDNWGGQERGQRDLLALLEPLMTAPEFLSPDYELLWPPGLFAQELSTLRAAADSVKNRERIEFLLDEGFLGETPMLDYQVVASGIGDPWSGHDEHLDQLAAQLPGMREHHEPKPYWPARHSGGRTAVARVVVQRRFAARIDNFREHGYFGRELPRPCVDDYDEVNPSDVLAARLGIPDL